MKARRTRGREVALQALYCRDVHEDYGWDIADETVRASEVPDDVRAFAATLVDGVRARQVDIDRMLAAAMDNWELQRLACVDRNVLRLAVHELADREDIPARVTINEAIELGKRFSTARSGSFINGVLDRVRQDLGLPAVTIDVALDDEPARSLELGEAESPQSTTPPDTHHG